MWSAIAAASISLTCLLIVRRSIVRKQLDQCLGVNITFELHLAKLTEGKRTVLVTGGNGFVGKFIAAYLLRKGLKVIVFDVKIPDKSNRIDNVSYVCGNILNVDHVEKALAIDNIDSVIHTASLIPFLGVNETAIWKVNVEGTRNLLSICARRGIKSFVYTSSATVLLEKSNYDMRDIEEDAPYPREHLDVYTASKEAAEKLVVAASTSEGMATVIIRPGAVFGRGDKILADRLVHGQDCYVVGKGTSLLDWVPVENVALAHVLAEAALSDSAKRANVHGTTYLITNNDPSPYREFLGALPYGQRPSAPNELSHWGHPRPQSLNFHMLYVVSFINLAAYLATGVPILGKGLAPTLLDFMRRTYTFRSVRAARELGFVPALTNDEAIRRLVAGLAGPAAPLPGL